LPIEQSHRVIFSFSDPGGNFTASNIPFTIDESKWKVESASTGHAISADRDGWYRIPLGIELALVPAGETFVR
jgi:hypothetical protein